MQFATEDVLEQNSVLSGFELFCFYYYLLVVFYFISVLALTKLNCLGLIQNQLELPAGRSLCFTAEGA